MACVLPEGTRSAGTPHPVTGVPSSLRRYIQGSNSVLDAKLPRTPNKLAVNEASVQFDTVVVVGVIEEERVGSAEFDAVLEGLAGTDADPVEDLDVLGTSSRGVEVTADEVVLLLVHIEERVTRDEGVCE